MTDSTEQAATKPARTRASKGEQTRIKILEAALDIIIEQGIRAVRHRAVARQAGVALGSTTYYFSSIEELILSAFKYWQARALIADNPFVKEFQAIIGRYDGQVPEEARSEVAQDIYRTSLGYLRSQLKGKRNDRLLELAFHQEAVRNASLQELVVEERKTQLDFLQTIHEAMGSPQPKEDAWFTYAMMRQLEQSAVLDNKRRLNTAQMRRVLQRHVNMCFGVEVQE